MALNVCVLVTKDRKTRDPRQEEHRPKTATYKSVRSGGEFRGRRSAGSLVVRKRITVSAPDGDPRALREHDDRRHLSRIQRLRKRPHLRDPPAEILPRSRCARDRPNEQQQRVPGVTPAVSFTKIRNRDPARRGVLRCGPVFESNAVRTPQHHGCRVGGLCRALLRRSLARVRPGGAKQQPASDADHPSGHVGTTFHIWMSRSTVITIHRSRSSCSGAFGRWQFRSSFLA